ncbi:hypothetical protein COLO4_35889 [Corchorus olitorius]|uniref:Uncharacterized protein n=1 Tax=Corchorus olitorius TaxID=93759 RepID=A0A1R3GCA0_9ROSI|nr:hypothetical protein COLO4_35889 [Corchorus olitorius]
MDLETLNSPAQNPMMAMPPMEPTTTAIRTRSAAEKKMGEEENDDRVRVFRVRSGPTRPQGVRFFRGDV